MSCQETLVIIKPDGLQKGLAGEILKQIEKNGLSVIDSARIVLSKNWLIQLYQEHQEQPYFSRLLDWMSSSSVLMLKIQGVEAIKIVKEKIIGEYPKGLRGKFSEDYIKNIAHTPATKAESIYELELAKPIFEKNKLKDQKRFQKVMVFALTGMSESGKSTVGRYLENKSIPRLKIVKIFENIRDRWSPKENFQEFIQKQEQRDPYALWDEFITELEGIMKGIKVKNASIESLYGGGMGQYLKRRLQDNFCIIYVDIPLEIRLQRQMQREGLSNIENARKMLLPRDTIKEISGIPQLKKIAGEIIDNSGTLNELYQMIDKLIGKYCK